MLIRPAVVFVVATIAGVATACGLFRDFVYEHESALLPAAISQHTRNVDYCRSMRSDDIALGSGYGLVDNERVVCVAETGAELVENECWAAASDMAVIFSFTECRQATMARARNYFFPGEARNAAALFALDLSKYASDIQYVIIDDIHVVALATTIEQIFALDMWRRSSGSAIVGSLGALRSPSLDDPPIYTHSGPWFADRDMIRLMLRIFL